MMDEWDPSFDSTRSLLMLVLVVVGLVMAAMLLFGQVLYVQPANAAILFTLPVVLGLLGCVSRRRKRTNHGGFSR
jgi:drug/metabolite transporter (DMT)-like permease